MRTLLAVTLSVALTLPVASPASASAIDSAFVGESAFLTLGPGQSGTFTVFFQNTGTMAWVRGTDAQVDLAACRDDQVTCDAQDPADATFNPGTWKSASRYATHTQSTVAAGGIATFTYAVRVPLTAAAGVRRFNGDLVVAATGRTIRQVGYYHDLVIEPRGCTPGGITPAPLFRQVQVGLSAELRVSVTCAGSLDPAAGVPVTLHSETRVAGESRFTRRASTDQSGGAAFSWTRMNPGLEDLTITLMGTPGLARTAVVRWTVAGEVLTCEGTRETRAANETRDLLITAREPNTGRPLIGVLKVVLLESISTGTATINGVSVVGRVPGTTVLSLVTDPRGVAGISVRGSSAGVLGSAGVTIVPRVFIDDDGSDTVGTSEFRVDCGVTTFGT